MLQDTQANNKLWQKQLKDVEVDGGAETKIMRRKRGWRSRCAAAHAFIFFLN